jgi:hypothetical protein
LRIIASAAANAASARCCARLTNKKFIVATQCDGAMINEIGDVACLTTPFPWRISRAHAGLAELRPQRSQAFPHHSQALPRCRFNSDTAAACVFARVLAPVHAPPCVPLAGQGSPSATIMTGEM